jgi:type I restriction enzyme R subunit
MPKPGENKTVQSRILTYAQEIGWKLVSRNEAEARRGFHNHNGNLQEKAQQASLYFNDILDQKVRQFNPKYSEAQGVLITQLSNLTADIYGNRDFLGYLRNQGKYFYPAENRELDLQLIEYKDPNLTQNTYEVTEEFYIHNGKYGTREDIVFLINGIPILVIECKNATKDEAIALGVDQIRRYHTETPELFVPQMIFTTTEAIGFSYGVTWNIVRRNIFNWKDEQIGQLEAKIKSFCQPDYVLKLLQNYILFAEKEETLQKFILRQHQTTAVENVIQRCHDPHRTKGLVWHTQGSGKTHIPHFKK